MITLQQLIISLPKKYYLGYNKALNKSLVYYTVDTPKNFLDRLTGKRLVCVDITSDKLAKKLGRKHLIHFISS